jgi:hypothetical protein
MLMNFLTHFAILPLVSPQKGKQEAEAAISHEAGETALMQSEQPSQANRYSKKTTAATTKTSNRQYLYVSSSACSKEDRQELIKRRGEKHQ